RPPSPSIARSAPEIGPPTPPAMAVAVMKRATACARCAAGNKGEVEDHAGEEARLRDAQQEAEEIEAPRAADEHHRRRDQAPGDHDARDPEARTQALEQQVARHLEEEVTDEEDAGTAAIDPVVEAEICPHLERCEADIDAVEVGDDVEHEHERD